MGYRDIIRKLKKGKLRFILIENVLKHMFLLATIFMILWGNIKGAEVSASEVDNNIFLKELVLTVIIFITLGVLKGSLEWSYLHRYLDGDRKDNVGWIKSRFIYIFGFFYIGLPLVMADNLIRYTQMRRFNNFIISLIVYYLISIGVGILAWFDAKNSLLDMNAND